MSEPYSPTAALQEFAKRLPRGGRVLDAGCGVGRDTTWLALHGLKSEGIDHSPEKILQAREAAAHLDKMIHFSTADLRLARIEAETYDGIWAHEFFSELSPPECQRVLAAFFKALKPKGILAAIIDVGNRREDPERSDQGAYHYHAEDFASLLRQSGFRLLLQGSPETNAQRVAFFAERIGA